MASKRWQLSLLTGVALLSLLCGSVGKEHEEKPSTPISKLSFEAYRSSSIDRAWVTPIGVAGHHRTFGVTYSGNLGDLPLSQFQTFYPMSMSKRPWVSGVEGLFYDAVGLAVSKPTNFWGVGRPLQQRLMDGHLPVVVSQGKDGGFLVEQTAFATLPGGEIMSRQGNEPLLAYVRVAVKNISGAEQEAVIWVWRSAPPSAFGEIGGLTRKFEPVKLVGSKIIGDSGNCHLIFSPHKWTLAFDSSADTSELRYFGRLSTTLQPGETQDFYYVYPYWPLSQALAEHVQQDKYEDTVSKVATSWEEILSAGMRVSVPDEKIGQAFDAGLVNTLLLSRRAPWGLLLFDSLSFYTRETQPVDMYGTIRLGHYNLMYDDSAQKAIVHTFLETGHPDYAREALASIFHAQGLAQPRGAAGQEGCLSAGNTTAVGERGCSSVWMSGTGYSLWAAAEYYRYTHDVEWIRKHKEQIILALNWIKNDRHRPDNDRGHQGLVRGRGMCDSKHASYHPYNDIVNYWGMKEMVQVLFSLGLAGKDWENEAKDYGETIKTIYEKDGLAAYQGFGSLDYGLTAGAAIMSGLYPLDSSIGRKLAGGRHDGWYGMYHGRFMIESGEIDKFLASYYYLVANHMSHGTHCNGEWPLPKTPDDKNRSVINVQPHNHSNAGFHFMTRSMLIYEDDKAIHLLRGIPSWWLAQTQKSIDVKQAPTTSGPISFAVSRTGDKLAVMMRLPERTPDKPIDIHLPLPLGSRLGQVEINGQPWARCDLIKNTVSFSGLSGIVHLFAIVK